MRRNAGFTLLEVVIAFAILGFSIATLYSTFQIALRRSNHDLRQTEATLLARSVLARVGTEWPVEPGSRDGSWEEFNYRVDQSSPASDPRAPGVALIPLTVKASVFWQDSGNTPIVAISTVKLMRVRQ